MSPAALRRMLHMATASVAVLGLHSPAALRTGTLGIALAAVLVEWGRLRWQPAARMLARLVPVYREQESRRPSGALWLAIGYAVAAWVPSPASMVGMLAGGLADPAGAAVGARWGRGERKSVPGTLAVGLTAAAAAVAAGLPVSAGLGSGVAAALLERWPGPFDDNLLLAPGVAVAASVLA